MPGKSLFIHLCSVILQYGLIFFMYYFLYQILRLMYADFGKGICQKATRTPQARLIVLDAKQIQLDHEEFSFSHKLSIGRSSENDVMIDDAYVSHQHAVIWLVTHEYILEDLASINHTYLNDQRVEGQVALASGDIIKIGLITFKFER